MPKRIFLACLCFVVVFTGGCSRKPKEKPLEKFSIAFQSWVGYGPFYLADEKGFFRDEGIEVNFIDEQLDSGRRDAFKAGMLDAEAGTIDLLASKRAQGVDISAVLEIDFSFGADAIVAVKDIQTLNDLIGRKVAVTVDDINYAFISYLFYKQGLPLDKVIIVSRRPEEVAQAFLDKEADAAVTWQPWLSMAMKRADSHIIVSSKDQPGIIIDTLNVRDDVIRKRPQVVKGVMRAWFRALEYYKAHPQEASEIIAKHYNLTGQQYRENIEGLVWAGYTEQLQPSRHKKWLDVFNAIVEIKFSNRRIPVKPAAESAINTGLLKELYENSD